MFAMFERDAIAASVFPLRRRRGTPRLYITIL
jgi:hypothetical protein